MITSKGKATRDRIVAAAATLMNERGVAGTSTEDVQIAADVSASQIYHYFADKRSLTRAVIEYWTDAILDFQEPLLGPLDDVEALRSWAEVIVEAQRAHGYRGGCPLGSLASELADADEPARDDIAAGYQRWQHAIGTALGAMRTRGELSADADVDALALALLVALQGGLLMSKTVRDGAPLHTALTTTIDHIATFTTHDRTAVVAPAPQVVISGS